MYSTLLGGSGDSSDDSGDTGESIAVDTSGKIYVSGNTTSTDFPVTTGAYQSTNAADASFVAKLDSSQSGASSLIYSTFLGGSNGDEGRGIAIDSSGNAYIAGTTASTDFPTTTGAFQPTMSSSFSDAFLTELNSTGTALVYSTYLGGSCASGDAGNAIALDLNSNPYVAGSTCSTDFPTYPLSAYQTSLGGAQNAFVTKLALIANPSISESISPSPNWNGWNNSAAIVTFTCIPGGAPISTCTSPITISSEGASQSAAGTAVDTATNSASTSASVNLDLTPPVLSISSPTSGATVSSSSVVVSGSISDALSGVFRVSCSGITGTITGSSFSCEVPLFAPSNAITVMGTDLAGNSTTATVNVSVSMTTPTSLQITPNPATVVAGASRVFVATDQAGNRRPDATWSVSDSSVATLSTSGSGALTGAAAGETTLTATIGGVSADADVTVLAGSSVTAGTVLWSAPAVSGYSVQQIVQAVSTSKGPSVYSIEADASSDILVRAFKADGTPLWQAPVTQFPAYAAQGVGDGNGGLLIVGAGNVSASGGVIDLNAQTGTQNWQFTPGDPSSYVSGSPAVGPDGVVYIVEKGCFSSSVLTPGPNPTDTETDTTCVDSIDGNTGSQVSQTTLPTGTEVVQVIGDCDSPYIDTAIATAGYTSPIVSSDGAVYMLVTTYSDSYVTNCADGGDPVYTQTHNNNLYLLKNGSILQTLNTHSDAHYDTPVELIPDGSGGILAAFTDTSTTGLTIASSAGARATFASLGSPANLVLGDQNNAFVTDGDSVVSFDATSVSQNWTYASTGGALSFNNSSAGGAVVLNDSELGLLALSSTGTAAAPVSSLQGAQLYGYGVPVNGTPLTMYFGKNGGELSSLAGPSASLPSVYASGFGGDPQQDRGAAYVPTSLKVLHVTLLPKTAVAGCTLTEFGIWIGVHYQVLDQTGQPVKSSSMIPEEKVLELYINGDRIGAWIPEWSEIGPSGTRTTTLGIPVGPAFPEQPTIYTNAKGQFWDVPYGACNGTPIIETETQYIQVSYNGSVKTFQLRRNDYYEAALYISTAHITNDNDISATY